MTMCKQIKLIINKNLNNNFKFKFKKIQLLKTYIWNMKKDKTTQQKKPGLWGGESPKHMYAYIFAYIFV